MQIKTKFIEDLAISTAKIADDAVTGVKIVDNVALAGSPTTTTQSANDNSTKIATTAYVEAAVAASGSSLEWQHSALDYIVDNTAAPPTEVSGDRYILSHDGGAPNAGYDGASAGDIVEFNGTTWDATTPTTGTFISVDDDTSGVYYYSGSTWVFKDFEKTTASTGLTKSGFDIQLADAAASNGIAVSSGAISAQLATSGGLKFITNEIAIEPADFAGTGLEDDGSDNLRLATQGNGIAGGAGSTLSVDPATEVAGSRAAVYVAADGVGINLDNSTLTHSSSTLQIKASGVGETELNNVDGGVDAQSFVLPTGYTAGAGTVAAGDTIDAAIRKLDGNIAAIQHTTPNKESFTLSAGDITNQYIDLANVAIASSIAFLPVGGIEQEEGVDYTVSLTGGVGGNTRITFAGDLATGGDAALVATDKVVIKYDYQS